MIRKITLGMTALLSAFSVTTLAAPAKTPVDVSVPSYNGGFTFGLAGLYLRPSTQSLDYGLLFPTTVSANSVASLSQGTIESIDPDYNWGYRINVGYVFPCTGNDVSLTYTNYQERKTDTVKVNTNETFFGTNSLFTVTNDDFPISSSVAKAKFRYQALDLDFGQNINVGCNTRIRFLGGLRLADLDSHFDANYLASMGTGDDAITFAANTTQKSEFRGLGPRFGIDSEYNLGGGFSVVGQAATALLVGNFKTTFCENDIVTSPSDDDTITNSTTSLTSGKNTRVVPNLTAKLGLAYNYAFCNPSRTRLTVEAGYQVDHFFSAADRLGVTAFVGERPTVDNSFDGPYVGIQIHI